MGKNKKIKKFATAYFETQEGLEEAIVNLKDHGVPIEDVLTPFPIHGLDELVGLKKSRIPTIGFIGGATGGILAFIFQTWIFTRDYPLVIGGKPYFSVPTFIPITFEMTVLFAAFFMVFAFLIKSKLGFGAKHRMYDSKITDDHFVIVAGQGPDEADEPAQARKLLAESGGRDVKIVND